MRSSSSTSFAVRSSFDSPLVPSPDGLAPASQAETDAKTCSGNTNRTRSSWAGVNTEAVRARTWFRASWSGAIMRTCSNPAARHFSASAANDAVGRRINARLHVRRRSFRHRLPRQVAEAIIWYSSGVVRVFLVHPEVKESASPAHRLPRRLDGGRVQHEYRLERAAA